ncbi:hypothetical protein [Bacteroides sp. 519]|uniref:hypothetical protein n=1 Tax=Bacteroides sp. 519 TaxID=2302937 RepID=UPI0013D7816D|nr:hypothetical protein [Bacteroides sp. 519]NDV60574.1 hypothetical protein [Bacteroides sp. 519]
MKPIYISIYLLLMVFFFFACERDERETVVNEEQEVSFDITTRKKGEIVIAPDDTIKWVRILAFDPPTEKCVYNKFFSVAFQDSIADKLVAKVAFRMKLDTIYHFVFIVNERSEPDQTRLDALAAFDESKHIGMLDNMGFSAGATSATSAFHEDKYIPMTAMIENVRITNKAGHSINGGDTIPGPIQVLMERLGVRLDLTFETEIEEKKDKVEYVKLYNFPTGVVPLFDKARDGTPNSYTGTRGTRTIADFNDAEEIRWSFDADKDVWIWNKPRVIIPSILLGNLDSTDEDKAVDLRVIYDDPTFDDEGVRLGINTPNTTYTEYYDPPNNPLPGEPYNYSLPRNTRLELTAIIKEFNIIINPIKVSGWDKKNVSLED